MPLLRTLVLLGAVIAGLATAVAGETSPSADGRFEVAQLSETPFFQRLFGLRPREDAPPQREPRLQRVPKSGAPRADGRAAPAGPKKIRPKKAAPAPTVNPKAPDARVVLVVGDRLADHLARGLGVAFADMPGVVIENAATNPGGLAGGEKDPARIVAERFAAPNPPAAVVAMLGVDDRASLMVDGVATEFRTAGWEKVYGARARALVGAAVERRVPFYWVGLVPMADPELTTDMAYLDEIEKKAAADGLGRYVDVWNAFSGESGDFAASGPDVTGQERQLRLKDGIGFTKSGARKLAFYVEQELRGWLAGGGGATVATRPQQAASGGLVVSLNDPEVGPDEGLAGAAPPPAPKAGTPLYQLVVLGQPLKPRVGRVDDLASP